MKDTLRRRPQGTLRHLQRKVAESDSVRYYEAAKAYALHARCGRDMFKSIRNEDKCPRRWESAVPYSVVFPVFTSW